MCLARERVAKREVCVHERARGGVIGWFVFRRLCMLSVVYGSALWSCRYVCVEMRLAVCCMWRETAAEPRGASRRVHVHSSAGWAE